MPFLISFYPEDHLVIKTFWGELTLEESKQAHFELTTNPLFQKHKFNGLNDCRRAIKTYNIKEAKSYFKKIGEAPCDSRWCALERNPKETALAYYYVQNLPQEKKNQNNVFTTVEAASNFLHVENLDTFLNEISEQIDGDPLHF